MTIKHLLKQYEKYDSIPAILLSDRGKGFKSALGVAINLLKNEDE